MKVGLIQLNANGEKLKNIDNACRLVRKAASLGAKVIILPEVFNYRGSLVEEELYNKIAEVIPGESIIPLMKIAKQNNINIIAGSIYEKSEVKNKCYNTCVVIDRKGEVISKYRKINLFKANIDGYEVNESKSFISGDSTIICHLDKVKFGISICYDLRFPELYREYYSKNVNIIVVLSSFTLKTGRLHWEILLRARAIENYCYVLAPNQYGLDGNKIETYGNTMIVDPDGVIIERLNNNDENIIVSDLNISNNIKYPSIN